MEKVVGSIRIDLLLFMYADMKGSDLRKINPNEFNNREKAIIDLIKILASVL